MVGVKGLEVVGDQDERALGVVGGWRKGFKVVGGLVKGFRVVGVKVKGFMSSRIQG